MKDGRSLNLIFLGMLGLLTLSACKPEENTSGAQTPNTSETSVKDEEGHGGESHLKEKLENLKAVNLKDQKLKVTATVNMLGDLSRVIGGDRVEVAELMGPGIDPHLYKASAGDVRKLQETDLIIYAGHHLEGKMVELLEKSKHAIPVLENVPKNELIFPEGGFGGVSNMPDPHVWFDVALWKYPAEAVRDALIAADPAGKEEYINNATEYLAKLEELDAEVKAKMASVPEGQRVLVTAHDAFGYFGKKYGLEVRGVQGVSTATEAGTKDVQELADFVTERKIPAIFVESSVPKRTVDAVIQAAKSKGHTLTVGGELFSDAMGDSGTPEGTYLGMVRHNANTISSALNPDGQSVKSEEGHGSHSLLKEKLSNLKAVELEDQKLKVTATVNMLGDLSRVIGGDRIEVAELMGAGVDPHLYKASAGDVRKLQDTDLIIYAGHHLEGKMVELLEKSKHAIPVLENVPKNELIFPEGGFAGVSNMPDPHVWFDVALWKYPAEAVRDALIAADPAGKEEYANNATEYLAKLEELDAEVKTKMEKIPEGQRVLVTAHDAFGYFGKKYGLEVRGVQGVSTETEAGTKDVQELAAFVTERKIPAIFIESSVPKRTVDAVIQAAKSKGHTLKVGGELFSDAMGDSGTPEGTYLGMVRHNAKTISSALTGEATEE